MQAAIGAASGLIGSVLKQLSNEFMQAYFASSQLGLNSEKIKNDLTFTQGLLHEAQRRGVSDNPGLERLVQQLSTKADEAENALDELHYFITQDQLDNTKHAVPDLGDGLRGHARHGRHALHHTVGNCLPCFSCSCIQEDDGAAAPTSNQHNSINLGSDNDVLVDRLPFDRVAMSMKIKSVLEEIHSLCDPVSKLLHIIPHHSNTTAIPLKRPFVGSTIAQDRLYGRRTIFEQTIKDITGGTYHSETLYVLPIVGPGGIGKTTFTQHLYNDRRTEDHFTVRVWVCVSTDFDVLKLTQQIHNCIPATEKEENNIANGTTNLDQLQISIARRLKYKRFLVVLDDIWKCDSDAEWRNLLVPFTKGESKGSMVVVTTRFPKIEERVKKATFPINLQGLEPKEFLEFFQACVFGENKPDQHYSGLIDTGNKIAEKLKSSPLAAKTVARLLKKDLSWKHWSEVLDSNEWKNQTNEDDIMPALKISYDYLPFHLKRCFPYFSLFPEDHRFKLLEFTRFWTAIGTIDSSCRNKNYLEELVENGFLTHEVDYGMEDQCYVMHDLLHDLSRSVSSQECVNISSLSFSANNIPRSIQHLSITIEDRYDANFSKEMTKLKSRINIGNLRTLMFLREYGERVIEILKDTFKETKGLRVLFIVMNSLGSLPKSFSNLLHLRYLKIRSPRRLNLSLPSTLSRFYHLIFLDLSDWHGGSNLPKYISRLVNLRHFIASRELHSNVPEVGKIEHLEELKEFHVKKECVGFELEQLGKLTNLGGELCVCNLEKVATKEEAKNANLVSKRSLERLTLVWERVQPAVYAANVVEGLQPHDNLRELTIIDYGGALGPPGWLCRDITIQHLDSLTLNGVSWGILPPFGKLQYLKILRLSNIAKARLIGPELSFMYLKEVEFEYMPNLEEWVVGPNCHLFPILESISCSRCPNLLALPFLSECIVPGTQDIQTRYPSLRRFSIIECPQLSLPPMPHISTLTFVHVGDSPGYMRCMGNSLELESYSGALAFDNMSKLERIEIRRWSKIPWTDLQKLTALRVLEISKDSSMQSMALLSLLSSLVPLTHLKLVNCENLTVEGFNPVTIVELKSLIVYNGEYCGARSIAADLLSELVVASRTKLLLPPEAGSFQLERLNVDCISAVLVAPLCSLLAATLKELYFCNDERVESFTEEEEEALQLLTALQDLEFHKCRSLPSLPQRLHSLPSLRELRVYFCPEIRSLPKGGLPTSLQNIHVDDCSAELQEEIKHLQGYNGQT